MVLLTIDSKESDFEVHFKDPIKIKSNHEIALLSATVWYSWNNISKEFENNCIKYSHQGNSEKITIPAGNYDIDNLNYLLQDHFQCNEEEDECPNVSM
jgi:hypothetical protein